MGAPKPGDLFHRVTIERRQTQGDDGYGNTILNNWTTLTGYSRISARVEIISTRNGPPETLDAGRMQSKSHAIVTIRNRSVGKSRLAISADDRVSFLTTPYSGLYANIRQITYDPENWVMFLLCEFGVAF